MTLNLSTHMFIPFVTGFLSFASNAEEEKPSTWIADLGLGYVKTTGNTETTTVKGDIEAIKEIEKWRHTVNAEGLNTSDRDITTAERYFLSGKSDYKYSEFNYIYATATYDKDHFSGFDYRTTFSAGYGRRIIHEPALSLDGEIGPGMRYSRPDTGESEDEFMGRLAANLKWKISDNSEFTQDLYSDIGEDATITKSITALSANINKSLALKLSYTYKYTSEVPVGIEKSDTETVVTIVYKYR
ncbi:MAG: DUF481 domain-containing protein [Gammaproteobacteria bacterium]|nr:DUF481 domain-containing protein [Gammaproteobacteria bacterium]